MLKRHYKDNILKIYKIEDNKKYIGFMLFNSINESKILLLDYFAIKPEYQNMGYGKKAIRQLKDTMINYYCIYGEIEKLGMGKTIKENNFRQMRMKFYGNLGFYRLKYDLELYKVIYTPICLTLNNKISDEEILNEAFKIYNEILGKKNVSKNCKIIK